MWHSNKVYTVAMTTLMMVGIDMHRIRTIVGNGIDKTMIILFVKNNMMHISSDNAGLQHHHHN